MKALESDQKNDEDDLDAFMANLEDKNQIKEKQDELASTTKALKEQEERLQRAERLIQYVKPSVHLTKLAPVAATPVAEKKEAYIDVREEEKPISPPSEPAPQPHAEPVINQQKTNESDDEKRDIRVQQLDGTLQLPDAKDVNLSAGLNVKKRSLPQVLEKPPKKIIRRTTEDDDKRLVEEDEHSTEDQMWVPPSSESENKMKKLREKLGY